MSEAKGEEAKKEDASSDLSAVNNLINSLTDTVESTKDGDRKATIRVYRTSQVIEHDGILEQAIYIFPSVVCLNVGGFIYHSTSYTLTQYPDSILAKMCNGTIPLAKDQKGNTFIDRDGATFRYILSFLRSKKLLLPLDFKDFDELENEAEYYAIEPLVAALKKERPKYPKQNSYVRLSYRHDTKGVVLAGGVQSLTDVIPDVEKLGGKLHTGENYRFTIEGEVIEGAQIEFPLEVSQIDALVQHILDCGYGITGTKFTLDGKHDQVWIFERRKK